MNDKAVKRLTEFLDSECDDYGLSYTWKWSEDYEAFEVDLKIDDGMHEAEVLFKYDEEKDDIVLAMSYDFDIWQTVREYGTTIKYFWMKVSYHLFPDNS
jgi:hypothetical protein